MYFQNMLNYQKANKRSTYDFRGDCFHRANVNSELTKSHETHGDTEFRYTFDSNDDLIVQKGNRSKILFTGTIEEFIVANNSMIESYSNSVEYYKE